MKKRPYYTQREYFLWFWFKCDKKEGKAIKEITSKVITPLLAEILNNPKCVKEYLKTKHVKHYAVYGDKDFDFEKANGRIIYERSNKKYEDIIN